MRPPAGTDIIHANTWSAFAFARHGLPTVATEHGYIHDAEFEATKRPMQRLYHRLVIGRHVEKSLSRCEVVTAVSRHVASAIQTRCRSPVVTVPNWVDVERFSPRERVTAGPCRILYAGTAATHKGFDAVRWLAAQAIPRVELWCQESLRPALSGARLQIHHFPPMRAEDMPSLYAQSDLVLVPSRYEGFGYVAVEAMSCGRAVVGFACAGLQETCDGGAADLVPVDDFHALRESIIELSMDPPRRRRMGAAGRQHVLSHFTESKGVGSYLSIYGKLH